MKLPWIGLIGGLALASGGLLLLTEAKRPHVEDSELFLGTPKHPVTAEMTTRSNAVARSSAAAFSLKDTDGKDVTIASPGADRPQFVYFVLDGCPCSFDAEPLFHDLSKQFKGQVDFVSVTDADPAKARKWHTQMLVPYPVISDPDLEIINAYRATNSVFSVLIDKSGRVEKMWPGYSVGILKEMNSRMAKLAGVKEKPFDTKYAPNEETSGCEFLLENKEVSPD